MDILFGKTEFACRRRSLRQDATWSARVVWLSAKQIRVQPTKRAVYISRHLLFIRPIKVIRCVI